MAEDNEEKMTAIKLLRETEQQIALLENKITDPTPKLSEQGLVVYKAMFDHITLIKKQQWIITNYASLLFGAIFVLAKEMSALSYGEFISLTVITVSIKGYSTLMLSYTHYDLSEARTRVDKAIAALFANAAERNALSLQHEKEPYARGLEFTLPLVGVIWGGAAIVIYYLWCKL